MKIKKLLGLITFTFVCILSSESFAQTVISRKVFKNLSQSSQTSNVTLLSRSVGGNGPTISSFSPNTATVGNTITITGTNFTGATAVSIGGVNAAAFQVSNAAGTQITAIIAQGASSGAVSVTTPNGNISVGGFIYINSTSISGLTAGANGDFTIPQIGQNNLNVIATPSFSLSKTYTTNPKLGISGTFWGTSTGIDSSKQKVGVSFLLPQASMIGINLDGIFSLTNPGETDVAFGLTAELNLLFKKINYLDTSTSKTIPNQSTNFLPFLLHPKIGFVSAFFKGDVIVNCNYNFLSVLSANDQFSKFFNTKKSVFAFPEVDSSYIFDLGNGSNQSIKISVDLVVNNYDASIISNSTDKVIPYIKIGFVSSL